MSDLCKNESWILQQDNAPIYNALSITKFLANKFISVLDHPQFSLDLAP